MPNLTDLARAITNLTHRDDTPAQPQDVEWGYRVEAEPLAIDDGSPYGDPLEDTRPDWLKETDDKGFRKWFTLRF